MDLKVKEAYLQHAMELHKSFPVVDAHLDLAGEILLRNKLGEREVIKEHYLEKWENAGINLIASSVYVESAELAHGYENALAQIHALKEEVKESRGRLCLVTTKKELQRVLETRQIGILLYMEGLDVIGTELSKLEELHDLGVCGAALTWSRENALATGCCKASEHRQIHGGLTEAGKEAVRKLSELSMVLDVSHLNDEGFEQICKLTKKPFLATHSGSRAVYDSYRNLTDKQLFELAGRGGVAGVNGCKYIAGSLSGNHLEMLCRHVEYMVEKMGAEHVGYGFDLCDSYDAARAKLLGKNSVSLDDCLKGHEQIPLVTTALLQRGMPEETVIKVIGGNFIRFFLKSPGCLPSGEAPDEKDA